jgi:hypothetical protein
MMSTEKLNQDQEKATSNLKPSLHVTLEEKQWIISRIERSLDAFEHGLMVNKEKFKAFADDQIDQIKTKQNILLSIMVVIATILVGSLASPKISAGIELYLLILLAAILSAMLGIFIFYSPRKSISIGLYWEIENHFMKD